MVETQEDIMAFESENVSEQSATSTEDRRSYRTILWGFFAFYAVVVVSVAGMAIAGSSFQRAAHFVVATWNQNGCAIARIVAPSTASEFRTAVIFSPEA